MGRLESLRTNLMQNAVENFRWRIDVIADWPYFLAPVETRSAFLDLFSDYPFPSTTTVTGWTEIRSHYDSLSESLGFTVNPPNLVLTMSAAQLADNGEYNAALEVLDHLVSLYPYSLDGPWQLANLHRVMGDTAAAIRYYEECLQREPNMVPARTWLDRLRGGR
jgi:tetratricopeptide (TPR) repeat protein